MLKGKKLGILGVGKLGESLASGLINAGVMRATDIFGSVRQKESVQRVEGRLGLRATMDSAEVVAQSDIVVIATKPQAVEGVLAVIDPAVKPGQLMISCAASVPTSFIEARIGHPRARDPRDAEHAGQARRGHDGPREGEARER
jgi:pyrroline-5-carboxylate reductase